MKMKESENNFKFHFLFTDNAGSYRIKTTLKQILLLDSLRLSWTQTMMVGFYTGRWGATLLVLCLLLT